MPAKSCPSPSELGMDCGHMPHTEKTEVTSYAFTAMNCTRNSNKFTNAQILPLVLTPKSEKWFRVVYSPAPSKWDLLGAEGARPCLQVCMGARPHKSKSETPRNVYGRPRVVPTKVFEYKRKFPMKFQSKFGRFPGCCAVESGRSRRENLRS